MLRRVQHQKSYILHTRPYSESSLLIDAFSHDFGRIGLLAKGARRVKSKVRGMIRPFQPLLLSWSGKGELQTLTGAESDQSIRAFNQSCWLCGCYMNELLIKLMHKHDPHEQLFDDYHDSLERLTDGASPQTVLRVFEKRLLTEIGYGLILSRDVKNNMPVNTDKDYHYHPDFGPVLTQNRSDSVFTIKGSTLLALEEEEFTSSKQINQSKRLMRALLNHSLQGRELKCRAVGQKINALN